VEAGTDQDRSGKLALNKFLGILNDSGNEGLAKGLIGTMDLGKDPNEQYYFKPTETGAGSEMAFRSMFAEGGIFGPSIRAASKRAAVPTTPPPDQPDLGAAIKRSSARGFSLDKVARKEARSSIDLKREAGAANSLAAQQIQYATALARATQGTIGLADETKRLADAEAKRRFDQDMGIAKATKREGEFKALSAAQGTMTSFLGENNLGVEQQKEVGKAFNRILKMSPKEMEDEITRIRGVEGPKTAQDEFALQALVPILNNFRKVGEDFKTAGDNATKTFDTATEINKEKNESEKEALRLSRILNTEKMKEVRITRDILAGKRVEDARVRVAAGQMSAREASSIYSDSIDAQIAARGVRSVNFGGVMGQTFKNEMSYNEVDAFGDFRDGVKDVAGTMKSSFADAFQSISSGATTVQGALANMAQSILSSINQMSTQIFTNMMFSKMFGNNSPGNFAKGGYVPGYATGGLVTGGSGHKDDVLTRMQGGEFVIKKSAVNKIGVSNLNAINGYANGGSTGPSMGRMGTIAAVSGAATGILGAMMQDRPDKPLPSRNYGKGRGSLGYLGGADPDSGQIDRASGGGTSANVSLSKGFVYYRRDPKTGQLISERARPTEGRFEVSNALSLMGRLDENDSRTSRMFDKEQKLADYQNYVAGEKASRRAQIRAVKDQKKSRLIGAYMNAAMLVGGAKLFGGATPPKGTEVRMGSDGRMSSFSPDAIKQPASLTSGFRNATAGRTPSMLSNSITAEGKFYQNPFDYANGGRTNGSLARVMGGEYIMSPEAVRTHGVGFMTELNRGNLPKYASGGLVGNQTGGVASDGSGAGTAGNMTNNVSINVNIDKSGKAEASASVGSEENSESSREESEDVQNNTGLGKALQSVVLDEIVKQQRPGGLLYTQN
jgi:hypothetical protein